MGKQKKGALISCKACSVTFYVPFYRIKTAKFCSLNCQNHLQYQRPKFKCYECNIEFEAPPSRKGKRKFCSLECQSKHKIEKRLDVKEKRRLAIQKHRQKNKISNYGNVTKKYIFSIREKKCEFCNYCEFEQCLDIHHIDANPSNNLLENLIILCVMCHRKVHRKLIKINGHDIDLKIRRFERKSDKIDENIAREIKILLKEKKLTHKEIAEKYLVGRELITKINNDKRWKHVLG